MEVVVGVDSSTGSTKVEARDLGSGAIVGTATSPHPATTPPVSEQHPDDWWAALVDAFAQLRPDVRASVVALSIAGQQHGMVLVDHAGAVVRPAKLGNDTTSAPQAEALVDRLGPDAWSEATGLVPVASFTITKLAWMAEHEPDRLAAAAKVMLPHDWLTWRVTGDHTTDRGDASGTGWFDPVGNEYRTELLDLVGGPVPALPRVLGPTEPAGHVVAPELGVGRHVLVGPGTGDNMGAALGLGLAPGDLAVSLGTSGTAYAVSSTPAHDATGAVAGFADATGRYLPLVATLNATKVTDAVAVWLDVDATGLAELALAAETEDAPTLIPYFDGERTPNLPDATGELRGLRTTTTRAQLALAAHDGVLRGLLDGVDALAAAGTEVSGTLHLIGGGARSPAYRQRGADLWGRPIVVPDAAEVVATGAAVQAAVVAGGDTFADVAQRWSLGAGTTVEPR